MFGAGTELQFNGLIATNGRREDRCNTFKNCSQGWVVRLVRMCFSLSVRLCMFYGFTFSLLRR